MTIPRTARDALDNLYEAYERHLAIAYECDNVLDERVLDAEDALQQAFFIYDRILFMETGMELPFDIEEDDEGILDALSDSHPEVPRRTSHDDDNDEDSDDDFDEEYEVYTYDQGDDSFDVDTTELSGDTAKFHDHIIDDIDDAVIDEEENPT